MFNISNYKKHILKILLIVVGISSLFLFYTELFFSHKPKVIFLDVGQGDSILIITQNGRQVLIDSGKYSTISTKISKYLPINDKSLDMFIATHPDIDHIAGFDTLLDEYNINYFIHSSLLAGNNIYRKISKKILNYNVFSKTVVAGEKIFIDDGMYIEVLSPYFNKEFKDPNESSLVLQLNYKNTSILLTGDAPKSVESDIMSMYHEKLKSNIIKLGHHGSNTSTSISFLDVVNPQIGIVSAGCNNSFGHPHPDVLKNLDELDIEELNTCDDGDIIFIFKNGSWNHIE